jgi:hypothetical protein
VVKFFRDDAVRQAHLLAAFQRQNWAPCILNPFCNQAGCPDAKVALHKAIERLNKVTVRAGLRFRGSGTGDVQWLANA